MSTSKTTIDFLLDQLSPLGTARARKMFGEYALYYDEKVVALVCDDQLFVKITEAGKEFVGRRYEEGHAYPGAKPSMLIGEEVIHDRDAICELVRITARELSLKKKK